MKLLDKLKAIFTKKKEQQPTILTFRKVQVRYYDGDTAYWGTITAVTGDDNGNVSLRIEEKKGKKEVITHIVSVKEMKSIAFYSTCYKIWLNQKQNYECD